MKYGIKTLIILGFAVLMTVGSMSIALADDESVVNPDIGPKVEGLTPGVDGYKVFGPNAYGKIPEQVTDAGMKALSGQGNKTRTYYLYYDTDCFNDHGIATGSHYSGADRYQERCWVDGDIQYYGHRCDDCRDHTSGVYAHCNTEGITSYGSWHAYSVHHWYNPTAPKTRYSDDPL